MKKRHDLHFALIAAIAVALSSCAPPARQAELALLDPAFAELFPSALAALRKEGYAATVLPSEESSRSLFAAIERADPARIILSPLLAQHIPAIAKSRPGLAIGALAFEEQRVEGATAVLSFRGEDAARAAAEAALYELKSLAAGRTEPRAAAIFSGANAQRRADAFKDVFSGADETKLPIVEVSSSDWSPDLAARLVALDLALIYVSVAPKELGRWLRELTADGGRPRFAFIIAESPQVPLEPWHNCDAIVYWHMEGSIKSLAELLRMPQTGTIDATGPWHYKKLR